MDNLEVREIISLEDYIKFDQIAHSWDHQRQWSKYGADYDIGNYMTSKYGLFSNEKFIGYATVPKGLSLQVLSTLSSVVPGLKELFDKNQILGITKELSIIIKPEYRRNGMGSYFLNQLIDLLITKDSVNEIRVDIYETNQNSIDFFIKNGFEIIGQNNGEISMKNIVNPRPLIQSSDTLKFKKHN